MCFGIDAFDGAGSEVCATSYESAIREAQFDVFVIPNQGAGAASARIQTARWLFPRIFFNSPKASGASASRAQKQN